MKNKLTFTIKVIAQVNDGYIILIQSDTETDIRQSKWKYIIVFEFDFSPIQAHLSNNSGY